ncbi:MAG: hypothetical protein GAK38_04359 [Xylophilus sp.]|nr:MAG: hypothetical protein GAK38_04359 [Xylophilus sp.]
MRSTMSSTSPSSMLSVISSLSRCGFAPAASSAASTCRTKSGWWNCRALTLTAMVSPRVAGSAAHCMAQQFVHAARARAEHRHADAGRDAPGVVLDVKRHGEGRQQPQGVVEVLEMVQVRQQQRTPLPRGHHRVAAVREPPGQALAVGQTGQRIEEGQPADGLLGLLAGGDVALHRDVLADPAGLVAHRLDAEADPVGPTGPDVVEQLDALDRLSCCSASCSRRATSGSVPGLCWKAPARLPRQSSSVQPVMRV